MLKFRRSAIFTPHLRAFSLLGFIALLASLSGCGGGGSNNPTFFSNSTAATFAGAATSGSTDGAASVARFDNPVNVAVDAAGTVFVCDFDGDRIRKITPGGVVSTLTSGANTPNFDAPFGICFSPNGQLFVSTDGNDAGARDLETGTLWRINLTTGVGTVVARNLGRPRGIAALSNTQIVLVDLGKNDVRLLNPSNGAITPLAGSRGAAGAFVNGNGAAARFNRPYGAAILSGNILLADQSNHALRLVTPAGVVSTFAGSGTAGYRDGARTQALFNAPQDVDIDAAGNIYISDTENHRIRRISTIGIVSTLAGDGTKGFRDGEGLQARFFGQEGLAVSRDGTQLYVADGDSGSDDPGVDFNRVRRLALR